MGNSPLISVIMPVYNGADFLITAIQSILGQTFRDFEFIIINDGSTDRSYDIIRSFRDSRIRVINNPANIGNYPSRNKGQKISRGKYICVMDADDISLSNRLRVQVDFMENNPDIGIAGSGFKYLGNNQSYYREFAYENIKVMLLRNNYFIHPTLIIRHDFLNKYNLMYDEKYAYSSDYDLLVRSARFFTITNIPEVLLYYRIHDQQITSKSRKKQIEYADEISINQLRYLGIEPEPFERKLHEDLLKGKSIAFENKLSAHNWIKKIINANKKKNFYQPDKLEMFLKSLLSKQLFFKRTGNILKTSIAANQTKINLKDVTFLMPIRVDCMERLENADVAVSLLLKHFDTNLIVLEIGYNQNFSPGVNLINQKFLFVKDEDTNYNKSKWINYLISIATTAFVTVWDVDAVVPISQILDAIERLRSGKAVMSFPFYGNEYAIDQNFSQLFKKNMELELLNTSLSFHTVINYNNSGGPIFMVNRNIYIEAGGENLRMFGYGLQDDERVKRMGILKYELYFSKGPIFHLWHPKSPHFTKSDFDMINIKELINICGKRKEELQQNIKNDQ